MKRTIATSIAALLAASAAHADTPAEALWNGGYIGIHAGGATGDTDVTCVTGCFSDWGTSVDTNGPFIGAQLGLNRLVNDRLVVGLEADISFSDISGDAFFGGKSASSDLNRFGTARVRAGILVTPTTMFYATGGLAWADWTDTFTPESTTNSFSNVDIGWTVGGGLETFVSDKLSFKIEYLYLDFGDETHSWADSGQSGTVEFDHQIHTVRLGVNYKLW
ncbi:MAG: porin family protein [Hyphomicrobium sp.]|nr:porin family protein [Hyphomicrobium sp.]